jgi:hypothetical protein
MRASSSATALGFGYILPATFLPVLARAVLADPTGFGVAWPVFGAAAAASTLLAAVGLAHVSRRPRARGSHLLMALGCLLPVLRLSRSRCWRRRCWWAALHGRDDGRHAGARAEASGDPTRALGRLTAAFAIGQMAGRCCRRC